MVSRVLLVYALVESAVVVALAYTIGVGWTVLLLLATFVAGLVVAGVQLKRHVTGLLTGWTNVDRAISDSALVGLGTLLVLVPGLASTAAGVLLLLPPTRAGARPVLAVVTIGRFGRRVTGMRRVDYIDGEVVEVSEAEPPALPAARPRNLAL
ncbi:MAG TPA: FxsA family protein [Mycobacterium sp.]|nr:FxsA family protein [Mycobacterium sp.]